MVEELATVDAALYSRLDSDTALKAYMGGTLRLYADEVPQVQEGSTAGRLPYLVTALLSDVSRGVVGGSDHFLINMVYSISAVTVGGSYATSGAMMGRVWEVLRDYKVQTVSPPLYIEVQAREERSRRTEIVDGKAYKWNAARYRLWVSGA